MTLDSIIQLLLKNRGLTTKKAIADFFSPPHPNDIISPFDSKPAIDLIHSHIAQNNPIAVYGDYDVDGICSTAILWETLHAEYPHVFPHIPHRRLEGYGLSIAGIDHCLAQGAKLIIAVDNGITAVDQVKYCRDHGCDILIIDHHEKGSTLPDTQYVLHATDCCAAGLTWFFCRDYIKKFPSPELRRGGRGEVLELVSLATICDMVPLIGTNRSFAKFGLEQLNHTTRPGLLALFQKASLTPNTQPLTTYHIGFLIGPRLNAMGRLEHAIDSLRLLCTKDPIKADSIATLLNDTNKLRQDLTESAVKNATNSLSPSSLSPVIVVSSSDYDEGVIGLIASKLVEKFHHPAIAISVGETVSKGSARSIPGFDITAHLRQFSGLLVSIGGHTMAAGFTIETSRIQDLVSSISHPDIPKELLQKTQRVDCEIPLSIVNSQLSTALKSFEPFGLGNPTPVFQSQAEISSIKTMGSMGQHARLTLKDCPFDAVWFNATFPSPEMRRGGRGEVVGEVWNIIYTLSENTYNGQTKLQLLIKSVTPSP